MKKSIFDLNAEKMKKSIFDFNAEKMKKLNLELIGTHYFKRYLLSYSIIMIVSILFGMLITIAYDFDKDIILDEAMAMLILILFVATITMLFIFKMFDLMKQYYDDKIEK